jgi:hypothetical protein
MTHPNPDQARFQKEKQSTYTLLRCVIVKTNLAKSLPLLKGVFWNT